MFAKSFSNNYQGAMKLRLIRLELFSVEVAWSCGEVVTMGRRKNGDTNWICNVIALKYSNFSLVCFVSMRLFTKSIFNNSSYLFFHLRQKNLNSY